MPTPETPKLDNFATVEEALAGSGMRTRSHLGSDAHKLTVDEVAKYEKEMQAGRAGTGYAGPYTILPGQGIFDVRNYWTSWQEKIATIPEVPPVTIDPEEADFPEAGGNGSFTVEMTGIGISRSWTVDKDGGATWIMLLSPPLHAPQSDDGEVRYLVDANTADTPRTGNFYVNGKTFTITQAEATP
jgi:hypothetical protein